MLLARQASSRLGQSYARIPPGYDQTSLSGGSEETATLSELLVYAAPELAMPGGLFA